MIAMGRNSYGEIEEVGDGYIEVGSFCSIALRVVCVTVGHNCDWVTTFPFPARSIRGNYPEGKSIIGHPTRSDIYIGHDVWVGYGVTIISPSSIGSGAVIGAGSVVRGVVPPYTIVYGNPTQVYCRRFSDEIVEALLLIKWWEWSDEKIRENIHLLCSNRVKEFVDAHSKVQKK